MSRGEAKNTSPTYISPPLCQTLRPFVNSLSFPVSQPLCLMVLHFCVSGRVTLPPPLRCEHTLWGTHQHLASEPHILLAAQVMEK